MKLLQKSVQSDKNLGTVFLSLDSCLKYIYFQKGNILI